MGMPEDEEDVPEHYFCEECQPEDHQETVQALAKGEKIWEARTRIWNNEKKSKNRKGKAKGDGGKLGWLKKDVTPSAVEAEEQATATDAGAKRKREDVKEESKEAEAEQQPSRGSQRQDKRRKPSHLESSMGSLDAETALLNIDQLPTDRQRIAAALSKIIAEDIQERVKSGDYRIPDGHTGQSLGDHYAVRIEYAMFINHGGDKQEKYKAQFRALHANIKQNKVLVEELLKGTLTADELSVMESKDLASAELQKERLTMKEELDRQVVAIQDEGPRTIKTHKGDEVVGRDQHNGDEQSGSAQPLRERVSVVEGGEDMSPPSQNQPPLALDTSKRPSDASGLPRRQSSQQFDMTSIWAKTAHSPTSGTANPLRPMQQKPRRRSSIIVKQPADQQTDGAKDDPDVDRLLQDTNDDDEPYSPADYTGADGIVWRGKLVQSSGEGEPTVNARFVAGRDLTPTVAWNDLLPAKLQIDGRLQVSKAEDYLCGLQWSKSSDVSVLSLTPYDDADAFNNVFNYFKSRDRYAVVHKDKPLMVKDLYIIPVETGTKLPEHIEKLEHCTLKLPIEEKLLLATFVITRADPPVADTTPKESQQSVGPSNGQLHLPHQVRAAAQGPSGSPLTSGAPTFSPGNNALPASGYGVPSASNFPPNPYGSQQTETYQPPQQQVQPFSNPLVAEILGDSQYCVTAQQVIMADPTIDRGRLENLRKILEEVPEARTDIEALARKLMTS